LIRQAASRLIRAWRGERSELAGLESRNGAFSFDVFDTLLVRNTARPDGIFDRAARAAHHAGLSLPDEVVKSYHSLRRQAEEDARAASNGEEITHAEIMAALAKRTGLPHALLDTLAEMEIWQESQALRGIEETTELVRTLRAQGRRVLLASDMYLPRTIIETALAANGIPVASGDLYLSHEVGRTKRTGSLFRYILEKENLKPGQLTHVGDHWSSDFTVPKRIGIRAVRYEGSDLTRHEQRYLESGLTAGVALAGASRAARLALKEAQSPAGNRRLIGANIAGPTLLVFLAWVLHEAKEAGIARLYFLARDGQFLLALARRMVERLGGGMELRYLYASRQAWFLPAVEEIGPAECDWILAADPKLTPRQAALRVNLDPASVAREFATILGRDVGIEEDLPEVDLAKIAADLRASPLAARIREQARVAREALVGYLRQEGLLDGTPWALVDVGWLGRLQDALRSVLIREGMTGPVAGFYFGLNRAPSVDGSNRKSAYFCAPESPIPDWRFPVLMEIFTAADHGTTLGFERAADGGWQPRLKRQDNPTTTEWGLADLRQGAEMVLDALEDHDLAKLVEEAATLRPAITEMMRDLMLAPTLREAMTLGDYPFAIDQNEQHPQRLAPPFRPTEALAWVASRSMRWKMSQTLWAEASRVRSGLMTRAILTKTGGRLSRIWQRAASHFTRA